MDQFMWTQILPGAFVFGILTLTFVLSLCTYRKIISNGANAVSQAELEAAKARGDRLETELTSAIERGKRLETDLEIVIETRKMLQLRNNELNEERVKDVQRLVEVKGHLKVLTEACRTIGVKPEAIIGVSGDNKIWLERSLAMMKVVFDPEQVDTNVVGSAQYGYAEAYAKGLLIKPEAEATAITAAGAST